MIKIKINYRAITIAIACLLAVGCVGILPKSASAIEQMLSLDPVITSHSTGDNVTLSVFYDVSDKNDMLTGVSIAVHYDSLFLEFNGYDSFLEKGDIKTLPVISEDLKNGDKDPSTDKKVNIQWVSVEGDWPGVSLPALLTELKFSVKENTPKGATQVNLVVVANAAGYKSAMHVANINIE